MKSNKGFTLIELVATITILSIIMMIAVPNVVSILNKNKAQTYVNDARKLVTLAKYLFESDATIDRPTGGSCVVILLSALDRTELNKGPENGRYDLEQSFVVIKYNGTTYEYRVQLYENYTKNGRNVQKGIKLRSYADLVDLTSKNSFVTDKGFIELGSGTHRFDQLDLCTSVKERS